MKLLKYSTAMIIVLLAFSISLQAQKDQIELGIRYLKLGNSYRESHEWDQATKYLREGYNIVRRQNNDYWTAVAHEYYGYFYRDAAKVNNLDESYQDAINSFDEAISIYRRIIGQKDGSNIAVPLAKLRMMYDETAKLKQGMTVGYSLKGAKSKTFFDISQASRYPDDVVILDLSATDLTTFPAQIKNFHNLERLDLSNNELQKIPEGIFSELRNLKEINLDRNYDLNMLPADIATIPNLEVLRLRNTSISKQELVDLSKMLPMTIIYADKPLD